MNVIEVGLDHVVMSALAKKEVTIYCLLFPLNINTCIQYTMDVWFVYFSEL